MPHQSEIREIPIEQTPFGTGAEAWRKVAALRAVLAKRERELLELKGPCSNKQCRLHYAHAGPCDTEADG